MIFLPSYEFLEWYKLDLTIRADLVSVIENVRRGANIELWKLKNGLGGLRHFSEQKKYLEFCLKKFGLHYRDYMKNYYVSKELTWLDKLWKKEIDCGEFLDYPRCCITAFEKGCREYNTRKALGPAVEFSQSLIQEKNVDERLLWTLHIPCKLDCRETLKLAEKAKAVLLDKDVQAAEYLVSFNQNRVYQFYINFINPPKSR